LCQQRGLTSDPETPSSLTQVSEAKEWGAAARSILPAEALVDRQWESVASDIKVRMKRSLLFSHLKQQIEQLIQI
jgi:hypothetical protein